jgi:tetratricopeptide (TPR) repeat protein
MTVSSSTVQPEEPPEQSYSMLGYTAAAGPQFNVEASGRHEHAQQLLREVLAQNRVLLGVEYPETLMAADKLALSLSKQGKCREAEAIDHEAHAVEIHALGAEGFNLAQSLSAHGKHREAEGVLKSVLAASQDAFGATHPIVLSAGDLSVRLGALADATALLNGLK